jgi:hypothetical protein
MSLSDKLFTGVKDTGKVLITGVSDTRDQFVAGVSL